jgi:outer membrane protein assembly factor BamE (lipoprotein component of BamABCDE complex)
MKKRHKIVVWIFVSIAILLAGAWWWYTLDHSIYAPGYNEKAFRQLSLGMTESEVRSVLGPPLSIDTIPQPEMWFYNEVKPHRKRFYVFYDLTKKADVVTFSNNGRVSRVRSDRLAGRIKIGMNHDQVLNLVGQPERKTPAIAKAFHYSRQQSNFGMFRVRAIDFDERGLIVRITAYDAYD